MSRKMFGKLTTTKLSIVETLQSAFGAIVGGTTAEHLSPEERLQRRAANDAAQR